MKMLEKRYSQLYNYIRVNCKNNPLIVLGFFLYFQYS